MNEMVERVKVAIRENMMLDWDSVTRAAIEAMRHPTTRMMECAADLHTRQQRCGTEYGYNADPIDMGDAWRAMIDAALQDVPTP